MHEMTKRNEKKIEKNVYLDSSFESTYRNYMKNDDGGIDSCGNGGNVFFYKFHAVELRCLILYMSNVNFYRKVISFPKLNCGKFTHRHLVCLPKLLDPSLIVSVVNAMCAIGLSCGDV